MEITCNIPQVVVVFFFCNVTVNNFQSIRNELFEEVRGHVEERQMIINQEKFKAELAQQDQKYNRVRYVGKMGKTRLSLGVGSLNCRGGGTK